MAFELAFGHIPATPVVAPPPVEAEEVEAEQVIVPSRVVDTPAEEDVEFGVHLTAHDNNDDDIRMKMRFSTKRKEVLDLVPQIYMMYKN